MQSIQTKYLCPTNHRGARVKATAQAGSKTYPWDHALNIDENHALAARTFATEKGWLDGRTLASGTLADGAQCHVLVALPSVVVLEDVLEGHDTLCLDNGVERNLVALALRRFLDGKDY